MLKNYKDLKVWQKSYSHCLQIYRISRRLPKEERYGLTSQIRRSAAWTLDTWNPRTPAFGRQAFVHLNCIMMSQK
ncbi:MAG: four helix bundle protein [Deltaproteobacteria bacterium]|nr:four helix bundle protein [Deltaproteobacteria bacterium]